MRLKAILVVAFAVALFLPRPAARASMLGKHSITLTWTASTSRAAIVYRVYRGTTSGGPYKLVGITLNIFGSSTLSWTDADERLTSGTTYYYVVTAAGWANNESADSNESSAVWP